MINRDHVLISEYQDVGEMSPRTLHTYRTQDTPVLLKQPHLVLTLSRKQTWKFVSSDWSLSTLS